MRILSGEGGIRFRRPLSLLLVMSTSSLEMLPVKNAHGSRFDGEMVGQLLITCRELVIVIDMA